MPYFHTMTKRAEKRRSEATAFSGNSFKTLFAPGMRSNGFYRGYTESVMWRFERTLYTTTEGQK
ncbi:hypothetical protein C0Q44_21380 [Paenibacillus sp. PCH8]|nr:hypothetical protein C0Q44_21380 [Paenibacillus sp. PCH8]